MTLRTFILGLTASFGAAWLVVVVIPFLRMRNLDAIPFGKSTSGVYHPKRAGRVASGALVYAANGCYLCHTQAIRADYAGNDFYRPNWAGSKDNADRGDTRRETTPFDFQGESFAQIGVNRLGPDLSNLGIRVENLYTAKGARPEQWLYEHLYNPRAAAALRGSKCPSYRFLFEVQPINGQGSPNALSVHPAPDKELVPTSDAEALVSYLLSLKKDDAVPAQLNFAPAKKGGED
jgi:cytochrome c oxidase cbb3-type subunit 2